MASILAVSSLLLQLALALPVTDLSPRNDGCASGVHIITVRGSDNPFGGPNFLGLAASIQARHPAGHSTVSGLDYPATFSNYQWSQATGVTALNHKITAYVDACPGSKIAIIGYSQGAQVAMDSVCGTTEQNGSPRTPPLSGKYKDAVRAVAVAGDPSRVQGTPYDYGSAVGNGGQGVLVNRDVQPCIDFHNDNQRMRSYCSAGDEWCDSGFPTTNAHLLYWPTINHEVAEWVLSKTA